MADVSKVNPNYQTARSKYLRLLANNAESAINALPNLVLYSLGGGIVEGGFLSVNETDNSTFDVTAGRGFIVDQHNDVNNPKAYYVVWEEKIGEVVTNLATETTTYVLLDINGNIVQTNSYPTPAQRRDNILLGRLGHTSGVSIGATVSIADSVLSTEGQLRDLTRAVGLVNVLNEVKFSAAGANLQLARTGGEIFSVGANFHTNNKSPNRVTLTAENPVTSIRRRTQTGNGGGVFTTVDPNNYDLNGVITAVGANKWTNQRIFLNPDNGNVVVMYGQATYSTLTAAVDALAGGTDPFVPFQNVTSGFIMCNILTVQQGTTDLSNSSFAVFRNVDKFGTFL